MWRRRLGLRGLLLLPCRRRLLLALLLALFLALLSALLTLLRPPARLRIRIGLCDHERRFGGAGRW